MPFPLSALDFGCRRRLRELATPAEAYDLQIAAPHFAGLHPIQKFASLLYNITFPELYELHDKEGMPLKLNDCLYIVENTLYLENITFNYDTLVFRHFIFRPYRVRFANCELTSKLLQSISARTRRYPLHLKIHNCTSHDGVTFELICKLFKTSRTLDLSNNSFLNCNWINDLITCNYSNMEVIRITGSIDILKIDESQFVRFVEAQHQYFRIFVTLPDNNDDLVMEQTLEHLFKRHFKVWPFRACEDYCGRTIYINFISSGIRIERSYLLIKDCDPRTYLYFAKKKNKKYTVM